MSNFRILKPPKSHKIFEIDYEHFFVPLDEFYMSTKIVKLVRIPCILAHQ